jgi:hypothetical protein
LIGEYCDASTIVAKLRSSGLLANNIRCPSCGEEMRERPHNNTDGFMFFCEKKLCRKKKSIRSGSFFEKSKLGACLL